MSSRARKDQLMAIELYEKLIIYDKIKDMFLVNTSHELRKPLHAIINSVKFLLEGKKGPLNPAQQEDLIFIHSESGRLARIVDDLLDASSIEKGEIKIRPEPMEPYSSVERIAGEMRILITGEKDLTIKNNIPKDFPAIFADPDRFKQIIYNLLHNAIKFTKVGEINLYAEIKGDKAEIKIVDTGIGIEKSHIKNIFNSNYKIDDNKNISMWEQGFGIGLSVVKNLVEIHGGQIKVQSTPGKGTEFVFTIPLFEGELNTQKPIIDSRRKINEKESSSAVMASTILIVDDEPSSQKVLADMVFAMGHNALVAGRGEDVMPILKTNPIDLVVLDIMLPDISGDLLCREIRKEYSMSELPILILTASGRITDLMRSLQYGANDFQKKPAECEELRARIQSLLVMKASVEEGIRKEFQYFYSEISPHFLYNTLNTIIGLSYSDTESSRKALYNLSVYLRGKMDLYSQKTFISLESEMELIEAYLEIEKMRYGDRLKVEMDMEQGIKAMIPPLTLQPLVENAVCHGLGGNKDVEIIISAKKIADEIEIIIKDTGPGISLEKQQQLMSGNSKRLGFSNVMKKINAQKRTTFSLESQPGKGTTNSITVPEAKPYESNIN
jgi:sensor histidine kinase YesM